MKVLPKVIIPTMLASDSSSYSSFKVIYNSRVRFAPISTIFPCNQEHCETNPIFVTLLKIIVLKNGKLQAFHPLFAQNIITIIFFILLQGLAAHVIIP